MVLGFSILWVLLHQGLYHFFAQHNFFQSPSQSPWLLMYATQLANLYVAQSTSTSVTPLTSHRSNNSMHCYIDGEASESITRTKFETSYSDVFSAYNQHFIDITLSLPLLSFWLCICSLFFFIHVCWSFSFWIFAPQKLVVQCQLLLYFIHFHCAQQLMTIL